MPLPYELRMKVQNHSLSFFPMYSITPRLISVQRYPVQSETLEQARKQTRLSTTRGSVRAEMQTSKRRTLEGKGMRDSRMWNTFTDIAGKGVGFAGQGVSRAVEAASYVGEVIAPASNDTYEEGEPISPGAIEGSQESPSYREQSSEWTIAFVKKGEEFEGHVISKASPGTDSLSSSGIPNHASFPEPLRNAYADREGATTEADISGSTTDRSSYTEREGSRDDFRNRLSVEDRPSIKAGDVYPQDPEETPPECSGTEEVLLFVREDSNPPKDEVQVPDDGGPLMQPRDRQRPLQTGESERPDAAVGLAAAEEEARTVAMRTKELELEVASLRTSLLEAEQDVLNTRSQSEAFQREHAQLQELIVAAFTGLPQVHAANPKGEARSAEQRTADPSAVVKEAASALHQALQTEEDYRDQLQRLQAARSAEQLEQAKTSEKLALATAANATTDASLREENQALRAQVRSLSQEEEEVQSEVSDLRKENTRHSHMTLQLKQVIEQMREISRTNAEKAAGFGQQLEEEKKTKGVLEQELTRARLENAELHARMDELDSSDFDKGELITRLKHIQTQGDNAQTKHKLAEEALAAKLGSVEGLHQAALQREQQLRSEVKALSADLALAKQDGSRHEEALGNLRGVVDEFQAERQTDIQVTEDRLRKEMALQAATFEETRVTLEAANEMRLLKHARSAEEALMTERRSRALTEGENARCRDELRKSRVALDDALLRLKGDDNGTLDRQLVINLIVRYVTSKRKAQVLELMAKMFNFTEEDKDSVGLSRKSPSFPSLLAAMFTSGQQDRKITTEDITGDSLSDMWMDFLMAETAEDEGQTSSVKSSNNENGVQQKT